MFLFILLSSFSLYLTGLLWSLYEIMVFIMLVLLNIIWMWISSFLWIFFLNYLFIYFWLCWVFVAVRGPSPAVASGGHSLSWCAGLSLSRPLTVAASHCRGLSRCGAQAPDAQAQQLWLTGPAAPRHVGSSQTRARTRVLRIGRQILNHCATREAPLWIFWGKVEDILKERMLIV